LIPLSFTISFIYFSETDWKKKMDLFARDKIALQCEMNYIIIEVPLLKTKKKEIKQ
jgi:hypothetical protein